MSYNSKILDNRTGLDSLLAHRAQDYYYAYCSSKETAIDYAISEISDYLERYGEYTEAEAKEILINKNSVIPLYTAGLIFRYHASLVSRLIVPCEFSLDTKPISYLKLIKSGIDF